MSRLTERADGGGITVRDMTAALEKLAELEDAEQDGRLAPFTLYPWDTVYDISSGEVVECRVTYSKVTAHWDGSDVHETYVLHIVEPDGNFWNSHYFRTVDRDAVGTSVFLTREAAETALKERVT